MLGVDCTFKADGTIQVKRVQVDGKWLPVGQGRQWLDEHGRHLLISLPNNQIHELLLRQDTLRWELRPLANHKNLV